MLHELLNVRVGGDDLPVPLLEREGPSAVRAKRDEAHQVEAFAAHLTGMIDRARPVDDIMRGAAAVDPEIATLRARMQETRYANIREFASWLVGNGPLRDGLSRDEAAAIVWTLTSPEVHLLLRAGRGWSSDRYQTWLGETLTPTLLP